MKTEDMKIFIIASVVFQLSACYSIGVCDYPLTDEGWIPVENPPKSLVNKFNSDDHWFTNDKGDYFACPELAGNHHCGNVYQIYRITDDRQHEENEIVCLT